MSYINLEEVCERSRNSAINWAKTNKGYSKMREDFYHLVDVTVDNNRNPRDSRVYKLFKGLIADSTLRQAAPLLSKAQQFKLRLVFGHMAVLNQKIKYKGNKTNIHQQLNLQK